MENDLSPDAHFLLVGDSTDLGAILGIVDRLPVNAFGQIFIEVACDMQIQKWELPPFMTITWLRRDLAAGGSRSVAPRGELIARAVAGWAAEWLPERHDGTELPLVLWIGCAASAAMNTVYRDLAERVDHIHVHHPGAGLR
ncbi:SIP domain-containing protein [Microbacterium marinilacus]|uniref:SIP-like Rossmann fold domain-containing protein n=1 Tax=Microbacterium marinilacus TaxID=415209 RepID=A0ABP7B7D6_9MICO|nr:SIP domain-containing protein [Microbacterium marinilacus]MBY0687384.1 siderophore-interacting protein [Microbacterium marinilacus]